MNEPGKLLWRKKVLLNRKALADARAFCYAELIKGVGI